MSSPDCLYVFSPGFPEQICTECWYSLGTSIARQRESLNVVCHVPGGHPGHYRVTVNYMCKNLIR